MTPEGTRFLDASGAPVEREVQEVDWDEEAAEKGGYETFMLKEIHEQPDAVAETVADRLAHDDRRARGPRASATTSCARLRRVVIVACGTSYHAGLIGRYAIEKWSRVPVEMDVASEFRYRDPVIDERDLVIGISQSGETADTLAAMRLAREKGAKVLAVTNIMGSQATRDADGVLFTRAGLEIGVAATKTFVAQVAAMYLLRAQARQGPRHARARGVRAGSWPSSRTCRTASSSCWRRSTSRCGPWPSTGATRSSSSTWAATWAWPWRSRARSSSRRSPTCPPTPTRPAR